MITQKTTKEMFDASVVLVEPRSPYKLDENNLIPGEIEALKWIGKQDNLKSVDKVFDRFRKKYLVYIDEELDLFVKNGYVEVVEDKPILTDKAQKIIERYSALLSNNRNKMMSDKSVIQNCMGKTPVIGSAYGIQHGTAVPSEYMVLAIESTGKDAKVDEMFRISVIHMINGCETEHFDTYLAIDNNDDGIVTSGTGNVVKLPLNAPKFDQIKREFLKFVEGQTIGIWYPRFINEFLGELGIDLKGQEFDLHNVASKYNHGGVNDKLLTLNYYTGVEQLVDDSLSRARAAAVVGELLSESFEPTKRNVRRAANRKGIKSEKDAQLIPDDGILYLTGLTFVFTGTNFDGTFDRNDVLKIVNDHGGIVKKNITQKLNYFVVGEQVSASAGHGKEKKYDQYKAKGCPIVKVEGENFHSLMQTLKEQYLEKAKI